KRVVPRNARTGNAQCRRSRVPEHTSKSRGVTRRKLSRLTSTISTSGRRLQSFSRWRAVYTPPKPPPRITMRVFPAWSAPPVGARSGWGASGSGVSSPVEVTNHGDESDRTYHAVTSQGAPAVVPADRTSTGILRFGFGDLASARRRIGSRGSRDGTRQR